MSACPERNPSGAPPAGALVLREVARLLSAPGEESLDPRATARIEEICRLTCELLDLPLVSVARVDESHVSLLPALGLHEEGRELPRCESLADIAVAEPAVVPDARMDPRLRDRQPVVGPPGIRFFAGFPLSSADGAPLGVFCAADRRPRELDEGQVSLLATLARQVAAHLESGRRDHSQHQLLRSLVEQSADGIIVADAGGLLRIVNPAAAAQYGVGVLAVPAGRWAEVYGIRTLDDQPWPAEALPLYRALRGERVEGAIWMVRRPDGSRRILAGSAVPLRAHDGTVEGALLVCRDETERLDRESKVRSNEQRLRALVGALAEVVWTTDPSGFVREPSESWLGFTGQTAAQMEGFGWVRAIHPDDREPVLDEWFRAVRDKRLFDTWYRLQRRDGGWAAIHVRGVPLFDDAGAIREWVGASVDETGRKEAEAEKERAFQLREDFLQVAAHELRTPLTALGLQLELMTRGEGALETRIAKARAQVRRLASLITGLVDVSRLHAGDLPVRREATDLGRLVEAAAERWRQALERARCPVALELEPGVVGTWDSDHLAVVLDCLLDNAARYGAGKPVALQVEREGAGALLRVIDEGIGIPPEDRERIFDRFERAVSLHHYGGLGLGLYLVRELVEGHGGSVTVDSAPGLGSTFTVRLPLGAS